MTATEKKAVFLSYASQDAEAARRICDALRASGVEVWFDADGGLEHGDEWDAKIRRQIKECVLFIPVISANTQARHEGYFRIEWDLAAERARGIASGVPFILPVVIDETREPDALVPDRFRAVQWTRLRGGEVPPEVQQRFLKLWSHRTGVLKHDAARSELEPGRPRPGEQAEGVASPSETPQVGRRVPAAAWIAAALVLLVGGYFFAKRPSEPPQLSQQPAVGATLPPTTGKPSGMSVELAGIRARIVPDRWTSEDYAVVRPALDRFIQTHPDDADAWALRSYIASLQVLRTIDYGTKVLQAGKADAEHALRLNPNSPLGELALGFHYVAMTTRGGAAEAARPHIERGLAGLPPDTITRYAEMGYFAFSLQLERVKQKVDSWLQADAAATFPRWCAAFAALVDRQAEPAELWAERGATSSENVTIVRSLFTLFEVNFYLRANLPAARAALDRVPATARSHHRWIYGRWLLALAERKWDEAIQELARTPDTVLYDRSFRGPKALLVGIAHLKAGRAAPAAAQFRESERRLRELLAADPDDEEMRLALALTLAYAGKGSDAESELATVEPLLKGRSPYLYSGQARALIAETRAVVGDVDGLLPWLQLIFSEPSAVPYKPASFRLDPRFESVAKDPRVEALLATFSAPEPAKPTSASTAQPASPPAPDLKSVAVLAFVNVSSDPENEYFSDGIADELLTVLQKIPGLRVAARTSAFSFKGKNPTVQEVGEKLGMAHVVDGSVRKSGKSVVITARLSRAATNEVIWSESYGPLELNDVFATQSLIAQKIVAGLRGQLTGGAATASAAAQAEIKVQIQAATKGGTENAEAYRLYRQGRYHFAKSTQAGWAEAERCFNAALQLDPRFAQAYSGLADLYGFTGGYLILGRTAWAKQRELAEQALALVPDLADARFSLGLALASVFEWKQAEEEMKRAIGLNPNLALARDQYAWLLTMNGRMEEALRQSQQALELDPLSPVLSNNRAGYLLQMGRDDEAVAQAHRTIALQPNDAFARALIGWALTFKGDHEAASRQFREARALDDLPWFAGSLGYALARSGDRAGAEAILRELDTIATQRWVATGVRVYVFLGLGDHGRALDALEKAYEEQDQLCWGMKVDRVFDPIRHEPRFRALQRKSGLD